MADTSTYTCGYSGCGLLFTARTADRRRGWARFCSKSCKAKEQDAHRARALPRHADHDVGRDAMEAGWDGHKGSF